MDTLVITPYLNSRAFVHHGAPRGCRLQALAPKLAVPAIIHGDALAAIVPVAALGMLAGYADLLGSYGIACPGPARSVLLLSRQPFAEIDAGTRIALSADSMSSVRLLFLLLRARSPSAGMPRIVPADGPVDAELVIGDAALKRGASSAYPYVVDLATAWQARHGLPMVFARWVIQNDATAARRAELCAWLDDFAATQDSLYARTALVDHARADLDAHTALHYLAGIRIALGDAELRGQQRYEEELARYPWPPEPAVVRAPAPACVEE